MGGLQSALAEAEAEAEARVKTKGGRRCNPVQTAKGTSEKEAREGTLHEGQAVLGLGAEAEDGPRAPFQA